MATNRPKLKFLRGSTYTFDVSNADLATHPFKITADSGSTEYTTGVTLTGTQGQSGAEIAFVVPNNAPQNLNYYCGTHGMSMGNHIFIPPLLADSDGSFLASAYRSHFNVTAASGTLYTSGSGTVYFMAVDEGVPASNDSDGTFFTDSDIDVSIDSDYLYGGGYGKVFEITKAPIAWGGPRGFWYGGTIRPASTNIKLDVIDYVTISTPGNAQDFGDLVREYTSLAGCSNSYRALTAAGGTDNLLGTDDITYFATATAGSTGDFGDLLGATFAKAACCDGAANTDRACISGGNYSADKRIEYVTVSTPGNSQDFGDLSIVNMSVKNHAAAADDTRGLFLGGFSGWFGAKLDTIDYITIATPSNASDFGDLDEITNQNTACSNKTRALNWCGLQGASTGIKVDTIQYVTIQTLGNAIDFGDANNELGLGAACSNGVYGVMGGGSIGAGTTFDRINNIDYVTIDTPGNASDFGDLNNPVNSHTSAAGRAA